MANLVGILVILIMVIGVRARNAWQATAAPADAEVATVNQPAAPPAAPEPPSSVVADAPDATEMAIANSTVNELKRDVFALDAEAEDLADQTAAQDVEREHLQLMVSVIEQKLGEQQQQLDAANRDKLERENELAASRRELDELRNNIGSVKAATSEPEILVHHPTPLAKTVFGREEHFRLLGGKLVHVPMNEMVEQLRSDAQNKLWKLDNADQITETIGPFGGFNLRYTMERRQRRVITEAGTGVRRTIELVRFVLFPVSDQLGEGVQAAFQPQSEFQQRISRLDPQDTTITVWTYPDSFGDFRSLKDHLLARGFLTAARPLPTGHPIGGSPEGSKSAAE